MSWITPPSTGPEDWRKRCQRIARQALYELWPTSPPLELTHAQMVYRAQQHCIEKGWPPPSERTIQRAINRS